MTGFGRGDFTQNDKISVIEVRTVNHRYNDISIRMPRTFNSFEDKIREYIQNKISRGKVDIFISYTNLGTSNKKVVIDKQLTQEYINVLNDIKKEFNISDGIGLSLISRLPDAIKIENAEEDQEEIWIVLKNALENAVSNLISMRENEGERLKDDIIVRLDYISNIINEIEQKVSSVIEEYREKLSNKIKELMKNTPIDENRVAMEVAIMSDKSSIVEEIVRLRSHLSQMASTLDSSDPIGRKLDFIVQEMNRESNTINSKTGNIEIIRHIINIKTEIEKIREQIQNIE